MNIQETFGIPKFNANMDLNDVINAVIAKFQPNKPEKSSITMKEFSAIDENNKPSLFMLDGGNILFSNMLFVNREDTEKMQDAIFATQASSVESSFGYVKIEFVRILGDEYFDQFNANNEKEANELIKVTTPNSNNILEVFTKANLRIKGLQAVEISGIRLTTEMVLKRILR